MHDSATNEPPRFVHSTRSDRAHFTDEITFTQNQLLLMVFWSRFVISVLLIQYFSYICCHHSDEVHCAHCECEYQQIATFLIEPTIAPTTSETVCGSTAVQLYSLRKLHIGLYTINSYLYRHDCIGWSAGNEMISLHFLSVSDQKFDFYLFVNFNFYTKIKCIYK